MNAQGVVVRIDNGSPGEQQPAGATGCSAAGPFRNQIRESLKAGTFLYTLEYVPDLLASGQKAMDDMRRNAELVGRDPRIAGLNIGDRVKSLDSFDTVDCGRIAAQASGKVPLLHLAGKDRTPHQARAVLARAHSQGLHNMLLLTGDGIIEQRSERIRYQESVVAIGDARAMSRDCVIAAAIAPFKYREEELANQYLKMVKKINAGADYLITNCGWDMRKYQELAWYRDARGLRTPLVANLLMPTIGWARGIHGRRLPGVFMSDDLFAKITQEHELGKARARELAAQRLALQIVGVRHMGYAGVQLSGVDSYEDLCEAIERAHALGQTLRSLQDWQQAWDEAHQTPSGRTIEFAPPGALYLFDSRPEPCSLDTLPSFGEVRPSVAEAAKFERMRRLHHIAFEPGSATAAVAGGVVRAMNATSIGSRALVNIEKLTKRASLGCESCGFCRIEYLFYNCPETCPKGVANGACAGTDDNTCEFKDRECIHNRKYRIAKSEGQLEQLERELVPAVEDTRGTSSWVNHFKGRNPRVVWLARREG